MCHNGKKDNLKKPRIKEKNMNSCVLMAKIVRSPQLRYTQDNQLAITEMMVEFEDSNPNNPPATLKAIAWGNLATEVEHKYHEGDRVVLTGRLKMDLVERQGYKEKVAELTVSHIYGLPGSTTPPDNVVSMNTYQSEPSGDSDDAPPVDERSLDDIPF